MKPNALYVVLFALVLGAGCGTPSAGFALADINQAEINKTMPDAVLRHNDALFVAYETACGNIVSRIFAGKQWSPTVHVTADFPRRNGERWDMPKLVSGPDGNVWLAYRSQVRRRIFFHRWLGESWGARIDGRGIFWVRPQPNGAFDEELRPIANIVAEGSRVHRSIEMRLTSSDEPPVTRTESIPMVDLKALPGEGVIFIDTRDVSKTKGLTWQAEFPHKHPNNPLLSPPENPAAPDAVRVFNRGTVLQEKGRFRMWYSATGTNSPITPGQPARGWQSYMRVCYAESKDGLRWQRPDLGLVEFNGSRHNNVLSGIQRLPTVFYDERDPDPNRRYKCFGTASPVTVEKGHLLTSADGLRWQLQPSPRNYPGTRPYYANEFHHVFRDDNETNTAQRWKAYGLFATGPMRRASQLNTSPDGLHWTGYPKNPIIDPLQGVSHCIHDLLVWPEMGRYVGLQQVGDKLHNYQWDLVVSRDGLHFSRVSDGRPFLRSGKPGQWDHGGLQASVPVKVGGESRFYYGGREKPWSSYPADPKEIWTIKSHCGLATIGTGRYAGFRPSNPQRTGILVTQPIRCDSDQDLTLTVNAIADEKNTVSVAILAADTLRPLKRYTLDDCQPLKSDGVQLSVSWSHGKSIKIRRNNPIRLQFKLHGEQSRLYGFTWQLKEGDEIGALPSHDKD